MRTLSKLDNIRLNTCKPELQLIFREVAKQMDICILCGHRGEVEQTMAFNAGLSKEQWPDGKHNSNPSEAVDVAPYPIDWKDIGAFKRLNDIVQKIASDFNVKLFWGGNFTHLHDYDHWEIVNNNQNK